MLTGAQIKSFIRRILGPTPFYPVHVGKYIRNLYFRRYIQQLPIKSFTEVLDAGCGDGRYAIWMAENSPWIRITGKDIKVPSLLRNSLPNLSFKQGDLRNLEGNEVYDFIYCIDVLEHIPNNRQVLEKVFATLKPSGYFYLHMPGRDNCYILSKKFFVEFNKWEAEKHIGKQYTLKEIEEILQSIGFIIVKASYTFAFFGKLAWELDRITDKKRVFKVILMPLLKAFSHLDLWLPKHKGAGILILNMKP